MSKKFKKLFGLFLVFALVAPATISWSAPTLVAVHVPNKTQEKSNWCWNGTSVAILGNKGKTISQSSFSTAVKGNSSNNSTASMNEVKSGLSYYGHSSTKTGSLSSSSIRSELSNSRPVIAGYSYKSGGGHMVAISGHDSSDDYIEVMDPGKGSKVYYSRSYFASNSSWTWAESLYSIK